MIEGMLGDEPEAVPQDSRPLPWVLMSVADLGEDEEEEEEEAAFEGHALRDRRRRGALTLVSAQLFV